MPEVRLLAGLRSELGRGEKLLRIEADSVLELLDRLIAGSGDEDTARALVFSPDAPDELTRDLRVLVNGRSIQFLAGLETPLAADDAVTLHLTGARGYPGG
jgi:molybdopterin converting factor small subunit